MILIKEQDITLVCELDGLEYGQTMKGVVSPDKQNELRDIKKRLESLSKFYKTKYDEIGGIFQYDRATGNPISYHGQFRRVWSGIFKGSENKQYAAQISFVINAKDQCLDVGFYFGRASSIRLKKELRQQWELELKSLGALLYKEINSNEELRQSYYSLFDLGFKAEIRGNRVSADDWVQNLQNDPTYSSVVFNLRPKETGEIEHSDIDLYVAMVMPLISALPERVGHQQKHKRKIKTLSPEQRAKQAERRALIGLDGEKFIMQIERERLENSTERDISNRPTPTHVSLISDTFGYDILSYDERGDEIFIEVKTTTLLKEEEGAKFFYISAEEYQFYESNKEKYRLYRVYDIYGSPEFELLNLSIMPRSVDKYKIKIP